MTVYPNGICLLDMVELTWRVLSSGLSQMCRKLQKVHCGGSSIKVAQRNYYISFICSVSSCVSSLGSLEPITIDLWVIGRAHLALITSQLQGYCIFNIIFSMDNNYVLKAVHVGLKSFQVCCWCAKSEQLLLGDFPHQLTV